MRSICSLGSITALALAASGAAVADRPLAQPHHALMPSYPFPAEYFATGTERRPLRGGPKNAFWANTTDPFFSWDDFDDVSWMTPIRDQGNCGSCFTFGSIAAVETMYRYLASDPLLGVDFSEQEVISCLGYATCDNGGTAEQVATYLKSTGVPDEACAPYTSGSTGTEGDCSPCVDVDQRRHFVDDWDYSVWPPSEDDIKSALLTGPVVSNLQVYSDFDDFPTYGGGNGPVYQRDTEDPNNFAWGWHIVAIVGWDDTSTPPSWIIKNSWGTDWGTQGYGKIARNQQDDCSNFFSDGTCFATHITTFVVTAEQVFPNGLDGGTGFDHASFPDAAPGPDRAVGHDSSVGHDSAVAPPDAARPDTRLPDGGTVDGAATDLDAASAADVPGSGGDDGVATGSCECASGGAPSAAWLIAIAVLAFLRRRSAK